MSLPRPILNKIPGGGMPLAKQESHIKDLTKLSRVELLDIKVREAKLLANKSKLQRLPDKGKRIQDFYDKVLAELERRSNVDEAVAMFSELNIATKGQKTINQMEWNGRLNGKQSLEAMDPSNDVLDSDDELEMDPLRIIAQHQMHERRVKVLPPEPQLITAADLAEIKSFETETPAKESIEESDSDSNQINADIVTIDVNDKLEKIKSKFQHINQKANSTGSSIYSDTDSRSSTPAQPEIDQHVRYLVEKTEKQVTSPQREKFKPYKTTISNVHDPEKERNRKKSKHWEVTAATPPLIKHNGTQKLTLMDSVEIQANYLAKLKMLQEKQAEERLAAKLQRLEQSKIKLPNPEELKTKTAFNAYRTQRNHIEGEQHYNEHDEVHDTTDEVRGGGVTYTVYE